MPPWLDGDVVTQQVSVSGTVPVDLISPQFTVPLGNTNFLVNIKFNGVNPWVDSEFMPSFHPSFKFALVPEWSTSPAPVVGGRAIPFSIYALGVGAHGPVEGNLFPPVITGKEITTFTCPISGSRYSEQTDGVLRVHCSDGSPSAVAASGTPSIPLRFFHYPETSNTREFVPADSIPAFVKYSGSARVAFTPLTSLSGPTDELICPYHPYGGFCIYRARDGGVMFGYWLVSIDAEAGLPSAVANYLAGPSPETWAAVRPLFVIQYRSRLPESVAVFGRDGATLIIA